MAMAESIEQTEFLDQFREEVISSGGALTVQMERLRNIHGYGRLGKYVTDEISFNLRGRGLGHVPAQLPLSQNDYVLVFQMGSPLERAVEAVRSPGPDSADVLKELVNVEASLVLTKIRQLVCA
jgi:hypothetical protein